MKRLPVAAAAFALIVGGCLCPACTSTVSPDPVSAAQASYDDGEASSGVLYAVVGTDGGIEGWVVSGRARTRYNALVDKYGSTMWTPGIGPDYGLGEREDGNWLMSPEAMAKFIAMSAMARMGL